MAKRAFYAWAMIAGLVAGLTTSSAQAVTVDAFANSSSGGIGSVTGVFLTAGQTFTVTVASDDLWSAGALPRWSNADGLTGNRFATGSDESGENAGTLIGQNFGSWSQDLFTAPYGSLVGKIGAGAFFLVGTNFSGIANATGQLSLYYWDSNNFDNRGFVSAAIAAVPGPVVGAGLPGIIMALGGLVVLARRRRGQAGTT
jgi:hypothetical protein